MALYPVYFVIVSSLKNRREYVSNLFGLPQQWSLVNYAEVFDRFNLWRALLNSVAHDGRRGGDLRACSPWCWPTR